MQLRNKLFNPFLSQKDKITPSFHASSWQRHRGTVAIYCTLPVLFVTTYSAWGQQGCVEGRGRRGQREVECWISLPRRMWALSPYGLSPAGQQTLWQLGLGGREGGTWETAQMELWPLRQAIHSAKCEKKVRFMKHKQQRNPMNCEIMELHVSLELKHKRVKFMLRNV